MPTYEYRCPEGHETEKFYKTISAAQSEIPCPECGAVASRQLSGGAGLVFKGSGFYLTDYGKNAHRGTAPTEKSGGESKSGESKSGASSSSGDSKKSDAAPKPAAESKPAPKKADS
jgi:putative FmdB family regulatory protein